MSRSFDTIHVTIYILLKCKYRHRQIWTMLLILNLNVIHYCQYYIVFLNISVIFYKRISRERGRLGDRAQIPSARHLHEAPNVQLKFVFIGYNLYHRLTSSPKETILTSAFSISASISVSFSSFISDISISLSPFMAGTMFQESQMIMKN